MSDWRVITWRRHSFTCINFYLFCYINRLAYNKIQGKVSQPMWSIRARSYLLLNGIYTIAGMQIRSPENAYLFKQRKWHLLDQKPLERENFPKYNKCLGRDITSIIDICLSLNLNKIIRTLFGKAFVFKIWSLETEISKLMSY